MKITTAIPRNKVTFFEEERKGVPISNFKRHFRARSFVDTDCSSYCSKKESEISQIKLESLKDKLTPDKGCIELEHKFVTNNVLRDINTISTIDTTTENETNNFKRLKKSVKTDPQELSKQLKELQQEKEEIIRQNKNEIDQLKSNHELLLKEKSEELKSKNFEKKMNIYEENRLLINSYKEQRDYLIMKEKDFSNNNVLRSDHEIEIENLKFKAEMKKRILIEKIKFYNVLMKEKAEMHLNNHATNKTYLSNFDFSNLGVNESSINEKSNFMTNDMNFFQQSKSTLQVRQSDLYDCYNSIVLKENNVIGPINSMKARFFSKG